MKSFTQKILSKLAAVVVALLLYGVIVILQTPRAARAAQPDPVPLPLAAPYCLAASNHEHPLVRYRVLQALGPAAEAGERRALRDGG